MVRRSLTVLLCLAASVTWGCSSSGEGETSPEANGGSAQTPGGGNPTPQTGSGAGSGAEPEAEPEPDPGPVDWSDDGFERVFELAHNRQLIHRYDTGLFIDVGHASALKYVIGRWQGADWMGAASGPDGSQFAWTDGIRGILRFPMTDTSGEWELVARLRGSSNDQRMDFFLNGEQVGSTRSGISSEWQELTLPLPAANLVEGENHVRFHFARTESVAGVTGRTAAAFDWVRIQPVGSQAPEALANGWDVVDEGRVQHPVGGGLHTYITIPDQAHFRARVSYPGAEPLDASVLLVRDGQEAETLWSGEIGSTMTPIDVPVGNPGEVAILDLRAGEAVSEQMVTWADAHIATPSAEASPLGERPKHIVVWLVDTLRVDRFQPYTPEARAETPNFDAFAEQCVNFRRATVQGNSSLPGSGSIFTMAYPAVHGLYSGDRRLPRDVHKLGEPFGDAGWRTALYSSNGYITESRGFAEGFDVYHNLIHEPGRADSEYLWPQLQEWLAAGTGEDSLLYVNTIDPHVPYDPPADILSRYYSGTYSGRINPRGTGELLDQIGDSGLSGNDLEYLLALYDGEVTYNDGYFGELVTWLETNNQLDDTLVVITSDHGEQFFEHGRGGHGSGVWETVVHVPLMFCHPRSLGAGRWIDTEVELIDIGPTIADLAGLSAPDTAQGTSLVPLMMANSPTMNRPGFSYHMNDIRGMRVGRWKYIYRGGDSSELYDLDESHIEQNDRAAEHPIAHRFMRDVISFHLALADQWKKGSWGFPNNQTEEAATFLDQRGW
ncbi:MAG: sulfatase, partial [Myxococcales bacterium]|nr:sulfatase [Myxococcales bacterium]